MTDPVFLVDSNICIYILRDAAGKSATRLGECEPGAAVTSAIVFAEVMRGLAEATADDIQKVERFFEIVPALPFDASAAHAYLNVPFKRGRFDRLIAAHALALGLTLVTSNVADFADVPGLKVEDWTQ